MPNAGALKRMATCFRITSDFLVKGTTAQKVESAISDAKLLVLFKLVEFLPEEDRKAVYKLIRL